MPNTWNKSFAGDLISAARPFATAWQHASTGYWNNGVVIRSTFSPILQPTELEHSSHFGFWPWHNNNPSITRVLRCRCDYGTANVLKTRRTRYQITVRVLKEWTPICAAPYHKVLILHEKHPGHITGAKPHAHALGIHKKH